MQTKASPSADTSCREPGGRHLTLRPQMVLCCVFVVVVVNPFRNTNTIVSSGPYRSTSQAKPSPGTSVLTTQTDVWPPGPTCGSVTFILQEVGVALLVVL